MHAKSMLFLYDSIRTKLSGVYCMRVEFLGASQRWCAIVSLSEVEDCELEKNKCCENTSKGYASM